MIAEMKSKYIAEIDALKRRLGEETGERPYAEEMRSKRARSKEKIAIYAIVHKATSRPVYVGKTSNMERRFREHASYKSQCRLLRDTFLKEGKASFEIRALMYCSESDADKNESMMIAKMNTIHPNGLNLRCGSMAGVEEVDNVLTQGNVCTTLVEFDDISEECEATADAWSSIGEMLQDVGGQVVHLLFFAKSSTLKKMEFSIVSVSPDSCIRDARHKTIGCDSFQKYADKVRE